MSDVENAPGCESVHEAMSALLDGEDSPLTPQDLTEHVVDCADCRGWYARAAEIQRRTRLQVTPEVPNLAGAVLASVAAERPVRRRRRVAPVALIRASLAAIALAQLWFSMPELLGHDGDVGTHPAHELGSFQSALGCGFLYVAWRPWGARGLRPLVGILALLLAATAILDLMHGRTTLVDEAPHLLSLAGFLALTALASPRLAGAPGGPTEPVVDSPPAGSESPALDQPRRRPVSFPSTVDQHPDDRPAGARRSA